MSFYQNYILEIKQLLNKEQIKEFNFFFILFFLAMLIEMLGVGMIVPVINLLVEQENFFNSEFFKNYSFFTSFTHEEIILCFIALIFFIYSFKSLFLVFVYKKEVDFLKKIRIYLSKKTF